MIKWRCVKIVASINSFTWQVKFLHKHSKNLNSIDSDKFECNASTIWCVFKFKLAWVLNNVSLKHSKVLL